MKLPFDEMFAKRDVDFVREASGLGELVHVSRFRLTGQPDLNWMPWAINGGFVIVTSDRNDATRGITVTDFKTLGARVILVGPFFDHANRWDRAKWLVNRIERLVRVAETMPSGSVNLVDRNTRATML